MLVEHKGRFVPLEQRLRHLERHIAVINEVLGRAFHKGDEYRRRALGWYRLELAGKAETLRFLKSLC